MRQSDIVRAGQCRVRFVFVPFSPCPPAPPNRPPRSVSSGCHNSLSDAIALEADPLPVPTLEETFRAERDRLLRYLTRRVGSESAPDLVQEVFARAAGSQQASQLANPIGFIRRITRNLLIDRARRRERNNIVMFPLDDERELSVAPEQGLAIEAEDLLRIYNDAVASLPEKTLRVFLMRRDKQLSYQQISEELGIAMDTVKYHMTRANAFIAAAVEEHR
nr:sigma-70 family RNA polymerase sigma factor [Sphingomonas lycopersici]